MTNPIDCNVDQHLKDIVLKELGGSDVTITETVQTLWSGYGQILRISIAGAEIQSAILKYIVLPESVTHHPRGWSSNRSHRRKIRSYEVEMNWYKTWNKQCDSSCRTAKCYAAVSHTNKRHLIIMEDLDSAGFTARKTSLNKDETKICLKWLANFHATFLNQKPAGLWQTGTYWHLATRPDEFAAMADGKLKKYAKAMDNALNNCKYQTLVHGDAKVANFCFSADGKSVAAVDFQYTGRGCGMKDVAYFLGSCLSANQCKQWETELIEYYFTELNAAIESKRKEIEWHELKSEWLQMYPLAWSDFMRFLHGWMPTHTKINDYALQMTAKAFSQLEK